ncbi:MAG: heavy metal-responsive transcriptional regulator [Candidatus Tectomicrobia bacterium]|nr:heavy metal-responsive transcriptional regulator [Candidatus Tectomicrobia bacterium]
MPALTIGKVAKAAGVRIDTVRFYEQKGLIAEPPRGTSGYRHYPEDTVSRIRFIRRAKELGFSLQEIRELLALRVDPEMSSGAVKARAEAKITDIEVKVRALQRMKETLLTITAACDGYAPVSTCPILGALETEEEHG